MGLRKASLKRMTKETQIELEVTIDGTGEFIGTSGIGFLTTC